MPRDLCYLCIAMQQRGAALQRCCAFAITAFYAVVRRRTALLSFSRASDASDSKTLAKDKSRQSKHAALASISARRHATHAQGHPSSSAIASAHLLRTQISKGVPESSKSFEDSSAVAAPVQHGGLEASHVNNIARAPQARACARRRAAKWPSRRRDARRVAKTREGGARALGEPRRVPRGARAPGAPFLRYGARVFETSRVASVPASVTRHAGGDAPRLLLSSGHRQNRYQGRNGLGGKSHQRRPEDLAEGR